MTIFAIYDQPPSFPPTDQSPACKRYQVGTRWVDSDGATAPTQADIDAILITAPSWTPLDFLSRFTQAELEGIATAARSNATVAVWMQRASAASTIHADHADTIAGMQAMVAAGLITAARSAQILSSAASP